MELNVNPQSKLVEIWLTHADQRDEAIRAQLPAICAQWKAKQYLVAVYRSGNEELYTATRDLLAYNKRRTAELAVRREKGLLHAQ